LIYKHHNVSATKSNNAPFNNNDQPQTPSFNSHREVTNLATFEDRIIQRAGFEYNIQFEPTSSSTTGLQLLRPSHKNVHATNERCVALQLQRHRCQIFQSKHLLATNRKRNPTSTGRTAEGRDEGTQQSKKKHQTSRHSEAKSNHLDINYVLSLTEMSPDSQTTHATVTTETSDVTILASADRMVPLNDTVAGKVVTRPRKLRAKRSESNRTLKASGVENPLHDPVGSLSAAESLLRALISADSRKGKELDSATKSDVNPALSTTSDRLAPLNDTVADKGVTKLKKVKAKRSDSKRSNNSSDNKEDRVSVTSSCAVLCDRVNENDPVESPVDAIIIKKNTRRRLRRNKSSSCSKSIGGSPGLLDSEILWLPPSSLATTKSETIHHGRGREHVGSESGLSQHAQDRTWSSRSAKQEVGVHSLALRYPNWTKDNGGLLRSTIHILSRQKFKETPCHTTPEVGRMVRTAWRAFDSFLRVSGMLTDPNSTFQQDSKANSRYSPIATTD
jgi:ribosome-associated translation inhibitor RaiA